MKLIDSDALLKQLGISERFNNADIPAYVIGIIKGMPEQKADGYLISRQDAIEKLECFCMEKALEDQNHPSAEHHKLNIAEYIHDFYPDVWRHAEKELEVPSAEVGTQMSLANLDKVSQGFKQEVKQDLIGRQDAVDAVVKREMVTTRGTEYLNGYVKCQHDILDIIERLPSAERKGEWIVEKDATGERYGRCSECGMTQYAGKLNYCLNCGADMRGEEDEIN